MSATVHHLIGRTMAPSPAPPAPAPPTTPAAPAPPLRALIGRTMGPPRR